MTANSKQNPLDPFGIQSSATFVMSLASSVSIQKDNLGAVLTLVKRRLEAGLDSPSHAFGTLTNLPGNVQLILFENAVNFCFWPDEGKPKWRVEWPTGNVTDG